MRPTLNIGDLAIVLGVSDASEIKVGEKTEGDIVVFHRPSNPDALIVQRAINKTLVYGVWYIRTQGDNASSPALWSEGKNAGDTWGDGFFHEKFLIGKVVGNIPYLGYIPMYVSAFLLAPEGTMFLFIALMFIVILLKYSSMRRRKLKPQTKAL
jgi:signal peptidase I